MFHSSLHLHTFYLIQDAEAAKKTEAARDKRAALLAQVAKADKEVEAAEKEEAAAKEENKRNTEARIKKEEERVSGIHDKVAVAVAKKKEALVIIQTRRNNNAKLAVPAAMRLLQRLLDDPNLQKHPSLLAIVTEEVGHLESIQPVVDSCVWDLRDFITVHPEVVQGFIDVKTPADAKRLDVHAPKSPGPLADIIRIFKFLNDKSYCQNIHYLALMDREHIKARYPQGLPNKLPTCNTAHSKSQFQQMLIDFLLIEEE